MVIYRYGNILYSDADVITNPVNCVGVMGKGLALQFKKKFPDMFKDYKIKCGNDEVNLGIPYLWNDKVLNFPTKGHWKMQSNIKDIDAGLKYLVENYKHMNIKTIAIPPLGCGLGGLLWKDVEELLIKYFKDVEDLTVIIYQRNRI